MAGPHRVTNRSSVSVLVIGCAMARNFLIVLISALAVLPVVAQVQPIPLNVIVTDDLGRGVRDLPREAFQVYEDKVLQPIVTFTREDAPLSIGIVFDTSGSMGGTHWIVRETH